jgi:class 3 adenylate cyclase/tetratricopeptide (TPR) repeat protein
MARPGARRGGAKGARLNCPRCERECTESQAFCGGCGVPLRWVCSSCAHPNPAEHEYCTECGASLGNLLRGRRSHSVYTPAHLTDRILTTRSAVEGERKDVTVLFADVNGSLELSGGVDAEEWHRILDRFFAILNAGVHRFDGTVNQYTGDGIMALFGAPVAHEDHAQRACSAALYLSDQLRVYAQELRREAGLNFAVRMGLCSGEVVVGSIGDNLRMDYTAQGYTVGLASRIMNVAEAGAIYLTSHTAERVEGFFRLEDLGEFNLKGVREPVRAYALEGPGPLRTRFDAARASGLSPFVGREGELAQLEEGFATLRPGCGVVMGVSGGPGIGKSRLCYEMLTRCRARGMVVHEGRCLPYGKLLPFVPVREILESFFGLEDAESAEQLRQRIEARVAPALHAGKIGADEVAQLLEFMGAPDVRHPAPRLQLEAAQRQLLRTLAAVLEHGAAQEPCAFLIEDLQWLDSASEAFVAALAELAARAPLVLLVNFRPEYRAPWMQSAHYRALALAPLSDAAAQELIGSLLGAPVDDNAIAGAICRRGAGNPFFLEELVRSWFEAREAGESPRLPTTVQAVIASRIDRLSPREKALLHTAAIAGPRFSAEIVAGIVQLPVSELLDALRALIEAELIEEAGQSGEAFEFRYPVVHEVAYRSQLAERRARVHRSVAEALEIQGRAETQAPVIAHHWVLAGDLRRGAQWHARAARVIAGADPAAAARHWQEVRSLLRRVEESREGAALEAESCREIVRLGWHVQLSQADCQAAFTEGRALAEAIGDRAALAALDRAYAIHSLLAGSVEEAVQWLDEALNLADDAPDSPWNIALRTWRALAKLLCGRLDEAFAESAAVRRDTDFDPGFGVAEFGSEGVEELIAVPRILSMTPKNARLIHSPNAWSIFVQAEVHMRRGELDAAERDLTQVQALAQTWPDLAVGAHVRRARASLQRWRGDADKAAVLARESAELLESLGLVNPAAHAYLQLGAALNMTGDPAAAATSLERALAIAQRERLLLATPEVLAHLADAYGGLGQSARALAVAEEAARGARLRRLVLCECDAQLALARAIGRASGALARDAIEAALARAEKLALEMDARIYAPLIALERSNLAYALGERTRGKRLRDQAAREFVALGAHARAARLEAQEAG